MKPYISYATMGCVLLAGTAAANAQTIITREVVTPPPPLMVTQAPPPAIYSPAPLTAMPGTFVAPPVRTVETVETVETSRPARRVATKAQVVRSRKASKAVATHAVTPTQRRTIYRTIVRENVAPAPAAIAEPAPLEPGYTEVVEQPGYGPVPAVAPAPVVAGQIAPAAPIVTQPYRYVYEGDRILVIDPNTNIAISAIPR